MAKNEFCEKKKNSLLFFTHALKPNLDFANIFRSFSLALFFFFLSFFIAGFVVHVISFFGMELCMANFLRKGQI